MSTNDFLADIYGTPTSEQDVKEIIEQQVFEISEKLAHDASCFLTQFEGTPLYKAAISLMEQDLAIEGERIQDMLRRRKENQGDFAYEKQDALRLKKQQLELELHKLRADGKAPPSSSTPHVAAVPGGMHAMSPLKHASVDPAEFVKEASKAGWGALAGSLFGNPSSAGAGIGGALGGAMDAGDKATTGAVLRRALHGGVGGAAGSYGGGAMGGLVGRVFGGRPGESIGRVIGTLAGANLGADLVSKDAALNGEVQSLYKNWKKLAPKPKLAALNGEVQALLKNFKAGVAKKAVPSLTKTAVSRAWVRDIAEKARHKATPKRLEKFHVSMKDLSDRSDKNVMRRATERTLTGDRMGVHNAMTQHEKTRRRATDAAVTATKPKVASVPHPPDIAGAYLKKVLAKGAKPTGKPAVATGLKSTSFNRLDAPFAKNASEKIAVSPEWIGKRIAAGLPKRYPATFSRAAGDAKHYADTVRQGLTQASKRQQAKSLLTLSHDMGQLDRALGKAS